MNNLAHEIAQYMFKEGVEQTMSGNYCFYFDDLDSMFGTQLADDDEAMMQDIISDMYANHDILDYDIEEDCFSWYFALGDCIGFRRDCTCKLCGKKIRQCNLGDIDNPEWDDLLDYHIDEKHPDAFIGFKSVPVFDDSEQAFEEYVKHGGVFPRCVKPAEIITAEDYFEIGEEY